MYKAWIPATLSFLIAIGLALPSVSLSEDFLTKQQVISARNKYKIKIINYDISRKPDYIRLSITNSSSVTLPFLTVKTNRYDRTGENSWSRYPAIPVGDLKPNTSKEYDYNPEGHLAYINKITVEIERKISKEDMQFFKELNVEIPTHGPKDTDTTASNTVKEIDLGQYRLVAGRKYKGDELVSIIDRKFPGAIFSKDQSITFTHKGKKHVMRTEKINLKGTAYYNITSIEVIK